ncbi:MAG: hypothetical protein ACRC40_01100 [Fusobacteriaceae bacterium]
MKKLALLLAAMTAVSAVASAKEVIAAPVVATEVTCPETVLTAEQEMAIYNKVKKNYKGFRATSFGMELEVESYSQDSNNDIATLAKAGFAYRDDITMEIVAMAKNAYTEGLDREFKTSDARAEIGIWKKLSPIGGYNHSVGTKFRSESTFDRLYARYKYSTGMVSGYVDTMYNWRSTSSKDSYTVEAMPVRLNYNGFGVGYYAYFEKAVETEKENFKQQVRFYTPSYNFTEKFSVNAEYRLWLGEDTKDENGNKTYKNNEGKIAGYDIDAAKGHLLYLNWSYDYSEALNLFAYTGYEFAEWNEEDGRDNRSYSDIGAGFNYKF